jgi:hypothetical protein
MIALKTHKTLQYVLIHFQIVLRELIYSLLKSLIKTVKSQIMVHVVQCREVCRLQSTYSQHGTTRTHTSRYAAALPKFDF